MTCPAFLYQDEFGKPFFILRLLAIPPEPPVAKLVPCMAEHSGQGRAHQGAAEGEPVPASTTVLLTTSDGRIGGMASILLVSSEHTSAYSFGVRYARLLCGLCVLYN